MAGRGSGFPDRALKGDKGSSLCNSFAKVVLDTDGADLLRLRIPDLASSSGKHLSEISGGAEWVEFPVAEFSYRRSEIEQALEQSSSFSADLLARAYVRMACGG